MMRLPRRALALAFPPLFSLLCFAASPRAAAMPNTAGISFDLSNITLSLVSDIDGSALPVAWRDAGYQLKAAQFSTDDAEWSDTVDTAHGYPARAAFAKGPATEEIVLDGPFGGMHGQAGFGNPTAEWRLAMAEGSDYATLDLPAHATLTLSGHVRIGPDDPADKTFSGFEAILNTMADGVTSDYFMIGNPASVDTDFRVVSHNTSDAGAVVWSDLHLFAAVTAPVPEPEPAMHALLACGLLVGCALRMGRRRFD